MIIFKRNQGQGFTEENNNYMGQCSYIVQFHGGKKII